MEQQRSERAADLAARRPTALLTELDDSAFTTRAVRDDGDPAYADEGSPDSVARSLLARGEPSDTVVETEAETEFAKYQGSAC